ncbi:MAG: NADH-quinone oxidoreductase subunit NuoE [Rhodobacteraceae bacterium]|nr:NADH-quinone oxidoreductase subunit NuoE [Paracoccaceae bacterium]
MLRRLYHDQPETFAFTPANQAWAKAQMTKYPEGRQASAIIPLLWRAQEQEGWLTRPAIEYVADLLGMAYIRALEVASFYFMFQLEPVGSVAHIQVCGTTSCMICGAEDLIAVCREKIAPNPHQISADGKLSWEEVECLGACANAPMAQIGKDYYEDLTAERFGEMIDAMKAGQTPKPGPQNGRFASEPLSGLTSLEEYAKDRIKENASVHLASSQSDTLRRIDGSEVPLLTPWLSGAKSESPKESKSRSKSSTPTPNPDQTPQKVQPAGKKPKTLKAARKSGADDLKRIKGVGPKLEKLLNSLGFFHFDQVASWSENEMAWVDQNLEGFKGRATRDNWVAQAKELMSSQETDAI